jgi:hypothetical protein
MSCRTGARFGAGRGQRCCGSVRGTDVVACERVVLPVITARTVLAVSAGNGADVGPGAAEGVARSGMDDATQKERPSRTVGVFDHLHPRLLRTRP